MGSVRAKRCYNEEIDKLLHRDPDNGRMRGRVCILCDKLMSNKEECFLSVKTLVKNCLHLKARQDVPEAVKTQYCFEIEGDIESTIALQGCLLSPRVRVEGSKRFKKVTCCKDCKAGYNAKSLKEGLPTFAMANGLAIGKAPECLTRLNETELALVSQARFRGHLFTHWGGCHRSIKGWHSFCEVDPEHTTAVLQRVTEFTSSDNIGVILCGPFTTEQRERVLRKVQVNVEWVLSAHMWLRENNRLHEDTDAPVVGAPTVIDNSEIVESENTDIETVEEMRVVFPDGTVKTGGLDDGRKFDQAIAEIRSKCASSTPHLSSRPSKRLLRDYEEDTLVRAFPLQFPYGCGPKPDHMSSASDKGYLKHLLSLSSPCFNEAAFVLVIHNMFERSKMLTGAMWQVFGGRESCELSEEELNEAIDRHCQGLPQMRGAGGNFLDSIKTVKRNMAHTNPVAQANQSKFICLSQHFGCSKVLFTVSFDDSIDIRIAALSGMENIESYVADCTSEQAMQLVEDLEGVRHKCPGLCALNFQWLMDLVVFHLVGDNPTKEGMFGKMEACGMAVEEQGRKTLHAHILVYVRGWNETLQDLHSSRRAVKKKAERETREFMNSVLSTKLTPGADENLLCPQCGGCELDYAEEQTLRDLRHRVGCRCEGSAMATCGSCEKRFTGDELARMRALPEAMWEMSEEEVKGEMTRIILEASSPGAPAEMDAAIVAMINYRFNHHCHRHTKTCFKKGDEGRCNLPDREEEHSHIRESEVKCETFDWKGKSKMEGITTARPERLPQDAHTNTHSIIVSNSKAPSNSNIGVTSGARSTLCASCYSTKNTQKEDTSEFKKVATFASSRWKETRRESTLFEGLSRLMGAVLVNTSEHVCAAPMAAYLVRNGSRFRYSHQFRYVPIREIIDVIDGHDDNLKMGILPHEKGCFFTNQALNYIMRPSGELFESMSVMEFYKSYEVVRKHDKMKEEDLHDIDDTDHPGFERQAYRECSEERLPQVAQWAIPDASSLGGSLYEIGSANASVEKHCKVALILFKPFRDTDDLTVNGSYHKGFLAEWPLGVPHDMKMFLSNVQMFCNSTRLPALEDPIRANTVAFVNPHSDDDDSEGEDDDDAFFDGMFDVLSVPVKTDNETSDDGISLLSLERIKRDGGRRCGFVDLPPLEACIHNDLEHHLVNPHIPQEFIVQGNSSSPQNSSASTNLHGSRDRPSPQRLMQLTFRNKRRRREGGDVDVNDVDLADGSVLSIIQWAEREDLTLDDEQRVSFHIIVAAFVLTYFDTASWTVGGTGAQQNEEAQTGLRHAFMTEKRRLRQLTRLRNGEPLRMFMDGAGGAGKSRVVDEVIKYAEAHTGNLGLRFDMRTIVVTAMSGVAATSIGGETLHSAATLNSNKTPDNDSWANARLLIVDEVSFMNTTELEKLDGKLRDLMRRGNTLYGGINVLFCGDFCQLEPCTGRPLYSSLARDQKWVDSINTYVELLGMHRFKDDPEWGHILRRLRTDTYTQHDIDAINKCLLGKRNLPPRTAYCVYSNCDRSAINAGIFSKHLAAHASSSDSVPDHILIVLASQMKRVSKSGRKTPLQHSDKHHLQQTCGDHRFKSKMGARRGGHFVEPMLKLHHQAPLMLVTNEDVPNGHANGTRVLLEAIFLKDGTTFKMTKIEGVQCRAVDAHQVEYLLCSRAGDPMKLFRISPHTVTCDVRAPIPSALGGAGSACIKFRVEMCQLPLLSNDATTGHKLQGQTKQNLVVSVWSKKRNWNYVALSRVKSRHGLFLIAPIPHTADFSIHPDLRAMIAELSRRCPREVDLTMEDLLHDAEHRRRNA